MFSYTNLQIIYLGVSLISTTSYISNLYIGACCNFVGIICFFDLYFVKKKDMIFHHFLTLPLLHYMNNHDFEKIQSVVSIILSAEVSTIFLTTNNLLNLNKNNKLIKIIRPINGIIFISTFIYFRIYKGAFLIMDTNTQLSLGYSKNNFYYYEIYTSIYGFFILNLYWSGLILKQTIKRLKS